jgi:hypothetical protein
VDRIRAPPQGAAAAGAPAAGGAIDSERLAKARRARAARAWDCQLAFVPPPPPPPPSPDSRAASPVFTRGAFKGPSRSINSRGAARTQGRAAAGARASNLRASPLPPTALAALAARFLLPAALLLPPQPEHAQELLADVVVVVLVDPARVDVRQAQVEALAAVVLGDADGDDRDDDAELEGGVGGWVRV